MCLDIKWGISWPVTIGELGILFRILWRIRLEDPRPFTANQKGILETLVKDDTTGRDHAGGHCNRHAQGSGGNEREECLERITVRERGIVKGIGLGKN